MDLGDRVIIETKEGTVEGRIDSILDETQHGDHTPYSVILDNGSSIVVERYQLREV